MDPDRVLQDLRQCVLEYDNASNYDAENLLARLVGAADALDQWMKTGGFSPWETKREKEN